MSKVDWTKWSAIAEIAGTAAVVVTLIYLVIQTQQNSEAIRSTARQSLMLADVDILLDRGSHPERLLLLCKADVTPEEDIKRMSELAALFRVREIAWLQYQSGVLDDETWESYRTVISGALFSDAALDWWAGTSPYFDSGFVEFVNSYLAQNPPQYDACGLYDLN